MNSTNSTPKTVKDAQDELKKKTVDPEHTGTAGDTHAIAEKPRPVENFAKVQLVEPDQGQSTEIETVQPAEIDPKTGQLILTAKHRQLIKDQIAPDATKEELELFFMMAFRTRLDPLLKQLYFIKYGTNVSYVTSIDGYRIIAHRTGLFAGVTEPKYDYDSKGLVTHCSVAVLKMVGVEKCEFAAKVKFSEYNTGKNLWSKMPETMIAKVAEAHALRKAFPQDLSGIYTTDEMDQATNQSKPVATQTPQKPKVEMITRGQALMIKELVEDEQLNLEELREVVKKRFWQR